MRFVRTAPCVGLRMHVTMLMALLLFSQHSMAWQSDSVIVNPPNRVRWVLSLDTRKTIIERKHVSINGVVTGVGFGRGHKVTVGYYWLNYGSKQRLLNLHKRLANSFNLAYYTKTDVRFVSAAYWYPLFKDRRWTVSIPAEVRLGQLSARYRALSEDGNLGTKHFDFIPYQLGIYGEYRVTPWVGVDLQIGYRDAIYHGPFRNHFKGPYYAYGLTIYPGRIYKDFKSYIRSRRHE